MEQEPHVPEDQDEPEQASFANTPFRSFMPVPWEFNSGEPPVYSVTRTHGLRPKVHFHNLADPYNAEREEGARTLLTYEINGRHYNLYTLLDMERATYSFDESGISNLRGDLAERVARRMVKRFLQRFEGGYGRLGGLFSKRFNPKEREGFVVAHNQDYVLKIGSYPNMILLKQTGSGKWGYQHITDLDGLFDYRYTKTQRVLLILESKIGKIDISASDLYERLFEPLQSLFPNTQLAYVLFADRNQIFDKRFPEYRILQDGPQRIYEALRKRSIPTLFFEFAEDQQIFDTMCRHCVNAYRSYTNEVVTIHGTTTISEHRINIFGPGAKEPYMVLEKDPKGQYHVVRQPHVGNQ